jgi:hypothetical protein
MGQDSRERSLHRRQVQPIANSNCIAAGLSRRNEHSITGIFVDVEGEGCSDPARGYWLDPSRRFALNQRR